MWVGLCFCGIPCVERYPCQNAASPKGRHGLCVLLDNICHAHIIGFSYKQKCTDTFCESELLNSKTNSCDLKSSISGRSRQHMSFTLTCLLGSHELISSTLGQGSQCARMSEIQATNFPVSKQKQTGTVLLALSPPRWRSEVCFQYHRHMLSLCTCPEQAPNPSQAHSACSGRSAPVPLRMQVPSPQTHHS